MGAELFRGDGLEDSSLTLLSFAIMAAMLLAREAGYRLGVWRAKRCDSSDEGVSVLVGSLLGLMSFVLAINLSASTTRLEDRRDATLAEVNAISTAWLHARAMDERHGEAIAGLLEDYLAARRAFAAAPGGSAEIAEAAAVTSRLQTEIWGEATALLNARAEPRTVALANSLTAVFDSTTAQTLAIETNLPARLVWLLTISSGLAIGGLGLYLGILGKPRTGLSIIIVLLWSGIMTLILDVGSARIGTINTDLRPYDWTAEGFNAHPPAGPAAG
jgi:hypothetical protein